MKPVLFIDNDFINNIFGRGKNFDEARGIEALNTLQQKYDIRITDTVYAEVTRDISWPKDRAMFEWLRANDIDPVVTNVPAGRDAGERSIAHAIENGNYGPDARIASDDRKFFGPDGEGAVYAGRRMTSDMAQAEIETIRASAPAAHADRTAGGRPTASSDFGRVAGRFGVAGGLAAGLYFMAQGDYAAAAEAAIPGGASAVALVDGRPTEATLSAIEEWMVTVPLTEIARPIMQAIGMDVNDGMVQSLLESLGKDSFNEATYQAANEIYSGVYMTDRDTPAGRARDGVAKERLNAIQEEDDPAEKLKLAKEFFEQARESVLERMREFVNTNIDSFPLEKLGIPVDDKGAPLYPATAGNTVLMMLLDNKKDGGFQKIDLESGAVLRNEIYSKFAPLRQTLGTLSSVEKYLDTRAANENIGPSGPAAKPGLDSVQQIMAP